jgi:hypothetical protein
MSTGFPLNFDGVDVVLSDDGFRSFGVNHSNSLDGAVKEVEIVRRFSIHGAEDPGFVLLLDSDGFALQVHIVRDGD